MSGLEVLLGAAALLAPAAMVRAAAAQEQAAQEQAAQEREAQEDGGLPDAGLPLGPRDAQGEGALPERGVLPEGTTPEARERWGRFVAATGGSAARGPEIRTFDLTFDAVLREGTSTKNIEARYAFVAQEGYLRSELRRSKRVTLRGPDGDWLIDGDELLRLKGRDFQSDKQQLDEWVTIARNFISLATPGQARVTSLGVPRLRSDEASTQTLAFEGHPAFALPPAVIEGPTGGKREARPFAARARELEWLDVGSPDFHLYAGEAAGERPRVFRALMGFDPAGGELELALLREEGRVDSTRLVHVLRWSEVDGYHVPRHLEVYRVEPPGVRFEARPSVTLFLLRGKGSINPELELALFQPPR